MKILRIGLSLLLGLLLIIFAAKPALAFCGFYVAKADSSLYNQASQVIIARDRNRTVLTMSNDYQGEVTDFAMVIPVPVVLTEGQVNISEPEIIDRLDAFSAPRLVEYFDKNPCYGPRRSLGRGRRSRSRSRDSDDVAANLGVTIEEEFTVGEYDILILSAKESDGLETWLTDNGYRLPKDAKKLLKPYIRQNMKFFVAKVNLEKFDEGKFEQLRPISIAYESPKFMLPIRLGMSNANGEQDLIVYLLSPEGQVELTNYRTVKIPADLEVPEYIEQKFGDFYRAMFDTTYQQANRQAAILEYAWDMSRCDPCTAEPLEENELKQAGVFWLNQQKDVFITRLHVRYTRDKFPEDLIFQSTSNDDSFQGRYIINHPYTGEIDESYCQKYHNQDKEEALAEYYQEVAQRRELEVKNLARITGWNTKEIRLEMAKPVPWWSDVWN